MKISSLIFALILISSTCYAEYKTAEFKDPNSHIPTVYKCAVVGNKQGYADDALAILGRAVDLMGITADKSGMLLDDAYTWYDVKGKKMELSIFWKEYCETPFNNIRRTSPSKSNVNPVNIAETATLEQFGSASCVISAMPKSELDKLLRAVERFAKSKDSLQITKYFQDSQSLVEHMSKCFESNYPTVLKTRNSQRDLYHFYSGSEKALGYLLLIELAKSKKMTSSDIQDVKDQSYNQLLIFNKEYY